MSMTCFVLFGYLILVTHPCSYGKMFRISLSVVEWYIEFLKILFFKAILTFLFVCHNHSAPVKLGLSQKNKLQTF